ncbi:MAG: hypothetical protein LBF54_02440 [Holosporaceae bacterium]|nr:hypothetical protein [Holosporaceae bacterium]
MQISFLPIATTGEDSLKFEDLSPFCPSNFLEKFINFLLKFFAKYGGFPGGTSCNSGV